MTIYIPSYKINSQLLERSALILKDCVLTVTSLNKVHADIKGSEMYDELRKRDLLRSMFVLTAAGIDSLINQVIKDCLAPTSMIEENQTTFAGYDDDNIRDNKTGFVIFSNHISAQVLAGQTATERYRKRLINLLTGNNLTIRGKILKIASFFNIPSIEIISDLRRVRTIFMERDKILHQTDNNFDGDITISDRTRDEILGDINFLIELGERFLKEIDRRLISAN